MSVAASGPAADDASFALKRQKSDIVIHTITKVFVTRQSTFESQSPSPSPQRLLMLQQELPPVHIFTAVLFNN